jgi:hypothetical protein
VVSLPEASDLTPVELEAATAECVRSLEELGALKRQGLTERQVVRLEAARIAAKLGKATDEVLAGAGLDPGAHR